MHPLWGAPCLWPLGRRIDQVAVTSVTIVFGQRIPHKGDHCFWPTFCLGVPGMEPASQLPQETLKISLAWTALPRTRCVEYISTRCLQLVSRWKRSRARWWWRLTRGTCSGGEERLQCFRWHCRYSLWCNIIKLQKKLSGFWNFPDPASGFFPVVNGSFF